MPKIFIPAELTKLDEAMDFITANLEKYHIRGKFKINAQLLAEEALVKLFQNAKENTTCQISVRRFYDTASITLSAKGDAFEDDDFLSSPDVDGGHRSVEAIRAMVLRANSGRILYSRRGSYNFVKIGAGARERLFALRTIFAFLFAVIVALCTMSIISEAGLTSFIGNVLEPVQTVFLNSLKLVTAPAVFFSLTTCIARLMSFSDPGKVTVKIGVGYLLTSIVAIIVGGLVFFLYDGFIGFNLLSTSVKSVANEGSTISSTLMEIIPSNIIDPFLNTNSVQLLVLALLSGIALGRVGNYSTFLNNLANALDKFFTSVVEIVCNFVPIATFFITFLMIYYYGLEALLTALKVLLLVLVGLIIISLGSFLNVAVGARVNPIIFLKKSWKNLVATLVGGSSLGSVPDTIRLCTNSLGVAPKLASFSIPFGATSNLDGNCVYLTIASLCLAKINGTTIPTTALITLAFMVLVLSIGAPITPGSAILALTILTSFLGVSLLSLSILLGVNAIIEILLSSFNTLDDIATTIVVAKKENLFDKEVYNADKPKRVK